MASVLSGNTHTVGIVVIFSLCALCSSQYLDRSTASRDTGMSGSLPGEDFQKGSDLMTCKAR